MSKYLQKGNSQNNVFYIQILPLSKAKESQKKKISSEGHIVFAFDELKCKKQLKHLVKEKKKKTKRNTELLESDDLVDGVVSMETVGSATAELTTSTREYEQDIVQAQTRKL